MAKNVDVDHFQLNFSYASSMAENLDVENKKPRTCDRKKYRNNHPSQFYKISVYTPLIEIKIEAIETKFSEEVIRSFNLSFPLRKLLNLI